MAKNVHFCIKDTDNCYHSYCAKMISTGECVAASRLEQAVMYLCLERTIFSGD